MYIDVHCHLDFFPDKKINNIVKRAKDSGVGIIISSGVNPKSMRKNLELKEKYGIGITLGVYPIDALKLSDSDIDREIEFIRKNKSKIVGIGEVGIDLKESPDLERQKKNFKKFINLAKELNLPIIVHSRKAEKECIEILESLDCKKVLMHYFSGKISLVKRILDNGWYLSIPSSVKYNEAFQRIAEEAPISQLLCETDSPFSHPDKKRSNEPKNVIESYKKIAEIKGLNIKEAEEKIKENYDRLFIH